MKELELREKRMSLVKEAQSILTAAPAEGMSKEDETRFDGLMAEADKVEANIKRAEEVAAEMRDLEAHYKPGVKPDARDNDGDPEARDKAEERVANAAFTSYLRFGMGGLSPEQRSVMAKRSAAANPETRALTETTTGGGFLIPQDFYRKLTEAYKFYGGMRNAGATILQTSTGATMPFPSVNDTGNSGARLAINTQETELDMAFGSVSLGAFTYSSKIVTVPLQLVQDSAFDLDSYLAKALGVRIGRTTNNEFTVGTGVAMPRGVVIDATLGKTGANGQTTTVIYDDLVDLEHAVDPAYRPQSRWMLHDSSLKVIKKLKDTAGRPLWRSSLEGIGVSVASNPDTINGYPYVVNNDMAVMAVSAKSILFGDFSNYIIRDVLGVQILRMTERFADFLQVGYLAFARADGALVDAGTHPIAFYANSAV